MVHAKDVLCSLRMERTASKGELKKKTKKKKKTEINNKYSLTYDKLDEMNVMKSLHM